VIDTRNRSKENQEGFRTLPFYGFPLVKGNRSNNLCQNQSDFSQAQKKDFLNELSMFSLVGLV